MTFAQLKQFRQGVYSIVGNANALFELIDAVLIKRSVDSFVVLSLSTEFRWQWSSIYAAADSKPPGEYLGEDSHLHSHR